MRILIISENKALSSGIEQSEKNMRNWESMIS